MKKLYLLLALSCCALYGVTAGEFVPDSQATSQDPEKIIERSLSYAKSHDTFVNVLFAEHEGEFVRLVKEGQTPKTLFIGCSDSRVTPEFITAAKPGDLFVVRNAGNFVPVYDQNIAWDGIAASIEYAVKVLGVQDVIVCGHSHCGAIQALFYDKNEMQSQLPLCSKWLQFGDVAKRLTLVSLGDAPKADRYAAAERLSVVVQLEHLLTFPFVKQAVADKKLFLHGWHFDIEKGQITYYNPKTYQFLPLRDLLK
ncbi:MAG: carbonic anhydrase [Verrucomicrobia bacterium]|nr:carbonic anhydrase [Verrucomicrobiota bacterium]